MEQVLYILSIAGLFFLRIGVPVLVLLTLGIVIDHWQAAREKSLR